MAEKRKRPYCEAELKNARALGSHVRFKHPGELGGGEAAAETATRNRGAPRSKG